MPSTTVRYLEPFQVKAFRPVGAVHPRVEIVNEMVVLSAIVKRVFPLSNPCLHLSIQDGSGKEVGILRTVEGLDSETDSIFKEELDRRYFTPHVDRIESLKM